MQKIISLLLFLTVITVNNISNADSGVTGSIGAGAIQIGAGQPQFAITPSAAWHSDHDWYRFSLSESVNILGALGGAHQIGTGLGINAHTVASAGAFGDSFAVDAGVSLAAYYMGACSSLRCGGVGGMAPELSVKGEWYNGWLANSVGLSAVATLGYYGGHSLVLPGGPVAMVAFGPIFRTGSR